MGHLATEPRTLISVLAVLGAAAIFLIIAGLKIHHNYATLIACKPFSSAACQELNSDFNNTDWTAGNTVAILMNLAPALLGAFVGAPLLARELETGSYRYAWTQGFGRVRPAVARLVLAAATITVLAWAFSQVFDWFFRPFLPQEEMTVLTATVFDTHGIAFAAWTLAGVSIGAFAGMLVRRIIPAMAITLGVDLVLALAAWDLRKYYPVAVVSSSLNRDIGPSNMNFSWILGSWLTGPGGKPVSQAVADKLVALTYASHLKAFPHGYTEWTRYIPVSKFWPMQLFAVLLGAAAIFLMVEGLKIRQDYAALLACRGGYAACQQVNNRFYGTDWDLAMAALVAMQAIPVLLAMFTGPAVVAGELETGTFRYAGPRASAGRAGRSPSSHCSQSCSPP